MRALAPLLRSIWPSTYFCGAILLLAVILPLPQNGKILGIGSICTFENFVGLPCPGCGLTRSFVAFAHGQFAESARWHPLGPSLFLGFLGYFVASIFLISKGPSFRVSTRTVIGFWLFVVLIGLFLWVLRLRGVFPLPSQ